MARNGTGASKLLRRLTQAELDAFLEKAADILRGNVDHSEFRGYVFALLFFKRISDVYEEEVAKLTAELGDETLAKDRRLHNFIVPDEFLWGHVARTARNELGTALNEAMIGIERANQPKFDGILTNKIDFNKADELPREKLINLINHFSSQVFDRAHVSDDVFGNAYEYLIRNFASKAGKSSGEFYTPREVAYLMSEMVQPEPGAHICDWASGSGGLLIQCHNYVKRHFSDSEADRLMLYGQESNVTTYNISRINLILHGVKSWSHRQADSLRDPRFVDEQKRLTSFDRIVMNPPFSLEDWGYDDFVAGDPYDRLGFGMPPRDNGDYAWLQHVVKSLKPDGKAIIVMSQGVLFRGQPEQTEEEDGRNQKADAEYVIREGFVRSDLIECVVVLPPKLFYGNNVPGCLIVLNKNKSPERQGKILMIWASRDLQKANPQNLLRPSDLMRILVPWRAFGNLEKCNELTAAYKVRLITEEELERDRRLRDIEGVFGPARTAAETLTAELLYLDSADFKTWSAMPDESHPYFGVLSKIEGSKEVARAAVTSAKKAYADRLKSLKREVRTLERMLTERDQQELEVRSLFDREIAHIEAAAEDLAAICSNRDVANKYFTLAEPAEIVENEFNLNMPRYVNVFEPEEPVELGEALSELKTSTDAQREAQSALFAVLEGLT